jgi:Fe-S-cluster containining protein
MKSGACGAAASPSSPDENKHQVDPPDFACIRCGVCCRVYQVRIGPTEAQQIAYSMDMDYWDWVGRYCDSRWSDPRSHLIKHDDEGCVFLGRSDGQYSLCSIYGVRPLSCRDWSAGIFKPACQEGLKRYWRVGVDASGNYTGSAEAVAGLQQFVRSL